MLATEVFVTRASFRVLEEGECAEECPGDVSVCMSDLSRQKHEIATFFNRVGWHTWNRHVNRDLWRLPKKGTGSRAFHKLTEILRSCVLPDVEMSVHLCESPGGFVEATANFATEGWSWLAVSLGGEGAIPPALDRLPTQRGTFWLHDVYDEEWCRVSLPFRRADFVTADGAVEMDHSRLEEEHLPLLLRQTACAMQSLAEKGTLVIKFFEGALPHTRRWIACMTHCFETVSVIKPTASRPTNSERYLVARGFRPAEADHTAFPLSRLDRVSLNSTWEAEVGAVLDRFAAAQTTALRNSLRECDA